MKTNIIIALISLVVIFLVMYLFNINKLSKIKKNKKKKGKDYEIIELKYLMLTYNLRKEKIYNKQMVLIVSLVNAIIISLVFFVVILIPWKIIWQLLIGFVLLLGLIYGIYGIIGKILVRKGYDKK